MKDLKTGEITPPLPHEEYTEEHRKLAEQEQKDKEHRAGKAAKAATPHAEPNRAGTHAAHATAHDRK